MATLWNEGLVMYHGLSGSNRDWVAHDKSRLWQYERHYHTEVLALAAQQDSQGIRALVQTWEQQCPPPRGTSWEPYPLARRVLHWSVALAAQPELEQILAPRLAPQVRHLRWHLEKHLLGNHLLCDLFALAAGAAVLDADGMAAIGAFASQQLQVHLRDQLLSDGGYVERTAQYHAIVLRDLLWVIALSRARGRSVPLQAEASRMLRWAETVARPNGSFPWINDASADTTPSLSSLQRLAEQAGIHTQSSAPPCNPIVLHDTGWALCRLGSHELLFDFGSVGPPEQPGHGHCDALAFELYWNGIPVITDTGVTTYTVGRTRDYERSVCAHATVSVEAEGADEVWASFRVGGRGQPRLINASVESGHTFLLMAECKSFRGWRHRRQIHYRPSVFLTVDDRIEETSSDADCISWLPLAPGWVVRQDTTGVWIESADSNLAFELETESQVSVHQGWQSAGFEMPVQRSVISLAMKNRASSYKLVLREPPP